MEFGDGDGFDGDLGFGLHMGGFVNFTVLALADGGDECVVADYLNHIVKLIFDF